MGVAYCSVVYGCGILQCCVWTWTNSLHMYVHAECCTHDHWTPSTECCTHDHWTPSTECFLQTNQLWPPNDCFHCGKDPTLRTPYMCTLHSEWRLVWILSTSIKVCGKHCQYFTLPTSDWFKCWGWVNFQLRKAQWIFGYMVASFGTKS